MEPQLELRNGSGGDALDAETQEELLLNSSNANPTETAETEHCNNTTANNCNNINNSNSNSHSSNINHKKLDTRNHNGDDATGNGSNDDGDEGVECLDSHDDNGAEKGGGEGGGGIDGGGGGGDGLGVGGGNGTTAGGSADELVLDVLNDDLIAQVRTKLNSGGKDIFGQCVTAVKAFLAGEPFREFENSMYFHRCVLVLIV